LKFGWQPLQHALAKIGTGKNKTINVFSVEPKMEKSQQIRGVCALRSAKESTVVEIE
jgi:hypothetical protein